MNQQDTPGLAVESLQKRIAPGLELLRRIWAKIEARKKLEEQRKEEEKTKALAAHGATPILDLQDSFYVAFDGDGIGNKIAQMEEHNDEKGLSLQSHKIERGQKVATNWAEKYGGKVIEAGGDSGILKVPSIAIDAVETLRADYLRATDATLTVGLGGTIPEATDARMLGKLRGKNQTVHHDETTEKELKIRQEASPDQTETKKLIAAGLGAPASAPEAPDAKAPAEEPKETPKKPEVEVSEEPKERPMLIHEADSIPASDDSYDEFGYARG